MKSKKTSAHPFVHFSSGDDSLSYIDTVGMGHNLLVIDADPQADTTFGFNIGEDAIKTSLADVLSRSRTPVESVVMPDVFPGVDLIPSHIELSRSELQLASEIAGENMLSRALAPIKDRYDAMGVHV